MRITDRIKLKLGLVECDECKAEQQKAMEQSQRDVEWAEHVLEESQRRLAEAKALEAEIGQLRRTVIDQHIEHRDEQYRFTRLDELDATGLDQAGDQ